MRFSGSSGSLSGHEEDGEAHPGRDETWTPTRMRVFVALISLLSLMTGAGRDIDSCPSESFHVRGGGLFACLPYYQCRGITNAPLGR